MLDAATIILRINSQPYGVNLRWSPHCRTDIIQLAPASAAVPAIDTACKSSPIRPITVSRQPGPRPTNMAMDGGIISTLLDCHSAACLMKETVERYGDFCIDDFEHFDDRHPVYLTNQITVTFRRPVLLCRPVELFSQCVSWGDDACRFSSELRFDGKLAASADVAWKRFRSRR
jgi:acyl-coenzyme A thioesterase PaaI-like protein